MNADAVWRFLVVDYVASTSSFSSSSCAPFFFRCLSFEQITQRNEILQGIDRDALVLV